MAVYINAQPWQQQYLFNDEQSGDLGSWITDSAVLPEGRGDGTAIIAKGFVFYFQGRNTSLVDTATIYRAPIVDGVIGTFSLYGSIPSAISGYARYDSRAVLINDVVHLIGGIVGSTAVATVLSCPVNDDGSLGTWSLGWALPVSRRGHSLACANGYLYCVAGRSATAGSDRVYRATIYPTTDANNGVIADWTWLDTVNLPAARQNGVAFVIGDKLYYAGGYSDAFSAQSTIYVSTIGANGSLSSFSTYSVALPVGIANPQYAVTGDTLYIVGGYGSNAVYYATIAADYSFGSFTAGGTLPTVVEGAPLVVSSSKAYLIGGSSGGSQTAIRSVAFAGGSDDYTGFDIGEYVAPLSITFAVDAHADDVALTTTVPAVISFAVEGEADEVSFSATAPLVIGFDIGASPDEVSLPLSTDTLFFAVDGPVDDVSATFSTPIICSFAIDSSDDVSWSGYGEDSGELAFNIDARTDTVSARFVNAANLFVVEAPADEVAMSIVAPSVLMIAARGYLDRINATFSSGRTEIAFSVHGYTDSVQLTGITASVLRIGVSSSDEVSMLADVEQRVVGAFKVDCPPDSISASFISHEAIRFSIGAARDNLSLSLVQVPVLGIGARADVDRISMRLSGQNRTANIAFARDTYSNDALVDATGVNAICFSRDQLSLGTTKPAPVIPIHFSR